ncbi:hypothetical protein [Actinocatenispora comari]|uniref:hypothetical protein n=1 Tax=Actinocatenispora comari TaxID=2807577 RepID=UPI001A922A35|nr:hypothetical protein [Actinocatenispora comari]
MENGQSAISAGTECRCPDQPNTKSSRWVQSTSPSIAVAAMRPASALVGSGPVRACQASRYPIAEASSPTRIAVTIDSGTTRRLRGRPNLARRPPPTRSTAARTGGSGCPSSAASSIVSTISAPRTRR